MMFLICYKYCFFFQNRWAKVFGDAIQTIQLYNPHIGSLVYSTGCGDEKNEKDTQLPPNLHKLFADPKVLKVGVNVHGDTCRIANTFQCNVTSAYNLMNKSEGGIKRAASTPGGAKTSKAAKGSGASLEQMSKAHCPSHFQLDKNSDGSKVYSNTEISTTFSFSNYSLLLIAFFY